MPDAASIVEVRNETPLSIEVRTAGSRVLAPLEVVQLEPTGYVYATFSIPPLPGAFLRLYHPAMPPGMVPPQQALLPPVVTIDLATIARGQEAPALNSADEYVERLPDLRASGQRLLQVANETPHVAEAWLRDRAGERLVGRIAPGEAWETPQEPHLLWHFRTASGLTLGAFVESLHERTRRLEELKTRLESALAPEVAKVAGADLAAFRSELQRRVAAKVREAAEAPCRVALTGAHLDAWRAYQQRPAATRGRRGLAPLRLIGERRASTPGPDDQRFISVSTVRLDVSKEPFNGLENREVRDVEIAGPLLRWSGANRILSGYYGEANAADIRSLTICCDRMEVADHLRFPRTNVTIHARELVFTGHGKIDTTPLPYPGRAASRYLTAHPDDPTLDKVPADEDGKPTYRAADGRKGEPGGNITVYAREIRSVEDPANSASGPRFLTCGGKGQQGEAGGLKAYVRGEGQPEKYGPLPVVTAEHVKTAFKPSGGEAYWHYRWPGGVTDPSKIPDSPWERKDWDVVSVSVFSLDFGESWLYSLYLPSRAERRQHAVFDGHDWSDTNGSAVVCNPREPYVGGWPGDGGDGGALNVVTEKVVSGITADQHAGDMGDPTLPVAGDQVTQNAVHVRLNVFHDHPAQQRVPTMRVERRLGRERLIVAGRAARPPAADLHQGKYRSWTDQYVTDLEGRTFYTRPNSGRRGGGDQVVRSDLSWAHPAAMAAVLSYARTAYRNGFREEAARALAPYHAVTVLQADAVARCSPEVQMAFASMAALSDTLALDVDYYGNPPGWVPRLNALSNLAVLKSVREAAYGTYYFADRMLRDAESLEDLRETAVLAQEALAVEMKAAKATLQTAYEQLPAAMDKLNQAQKRVLGVEGEIVNLRQEAIARSVDQVVLQRFVSAALQLVDGVAKSLPVGQPFLGLAGSVFGAAAKIDWTAEKPLETAGAAVDHLSEQVASFVTDKADTVASAVTGTLRGKAIEGEDLVTRLTREQEDAAKAPAEAVAEVGLTWKDFKSEELRKIEAQIDKTKQAIDAIRDAAKDEADADGQTAGEFLSALQRQKELLARQRVASLQKELTEYRKQQIPLMAAAEKLAKAKNAQMKALAAQAPKTDLPPTVEQKLAAATRRSEDQKKLVERKEATAKETMAKLADLGAGLASVGRAVVGMATPVTDEDPTVQRLADQLLVSDPVLRAAGQRLAAKLQELTTEKQQAAAELLRWQQQATTSLATVLRNLATTSQLARQRQSLDMGLNPAAKAYLRETRDAAKDALAESIYWFVKSYQYEQLDDVEDSFFDFDSWASELRKQENAKLAQAAPAPQPPEGPGAVVTRAPKILLDKEDFDRIGDAVFKAEQLRLGRTLLERRQKRAPKPEGEYVACVLRRSEQPRDDRERRQTEMLETLAREGEVAFDFVRDFGKGSYDWNDARVAQVKLVKLDIDASDPTLSLTFRVQQRGEMVIADKVGDERRYYRFRPGRHDDPLGWTFVYNHRDRKTNSGIKVPPVPDPLGNIAKEMLAANLTFEEYQPALFSDYVIRITDLFGADGTRKPLIAIKELEMTVFLSAR